MLFYKEKVPLLQGFGYGNVKGLYLVTNFLIYIRYRSMQTNSLISIKAKGVESEFIGNDGGY